MGDVKQKLKIFFQEKKRVKNPLVPIDMNLLGNPTCCYASTPLIPNPSITTRKIHSCNAISTTHITTRRRCDLYDLHKEVVPYAEAWSWQKAIVEEKRALSDKSEDFSDSLIILQHHPVYTMGTGSSENYLNFDVKNAPFDLYRTERGGEVTYHGPGQLVMYPIINLRFYKMDLHWYLRSLEEVVIRALSSTFAVEASRVDGLTGVWVGDKKLAAIGIKVSKWIAYHGLALNVTTDLTPFHQIVPCGIKDRQVGSIKGLLNKNECRAADNQLDDDQDLMYATCKSLKIRYLDFAVGWTCLWLPALEQVRGMKVLDSVMFPSLSEVHGLIVMQVPPAPVIYECLPSKAASTISAGV